ncbi:hypothetical protein Nepgr_029366 [Nepenthes gracilis]|uniref:Mediator of RNA polymerase II transcription subunit 25 n=1 Tax=Nepenthes gracilis TaxID=150966 RepID=A0AAD3Y375_NEPGR|nr:hypothetical protein Nepgr_029366 [Nepenthes gracilis]
MAADKQLIVAVEGSAALGYHWPTILSDYLEKIVRSFCGSETTGQKPSMSTASGSAFELAIVMFHTQGPYSGCGPQRSSWTRDVDNFLEWLSSLTFSGGGFDHAAIADGLAEALMMFAIPQNGYQTQQNLEGRRHCILIAATNPFPLGTPVYRPNIGNLEQDNNIEGQPENHLYDAEAVAKWFGQCSVSLSVICPKPLPKIRAIYNAGKRNPRAPDPSIEVKQPHFLVLISENFVEARAALSRTLLVPIQNPVTSLPQGSGPPTSLSPVNGSMMNRTTISVGNIPQATVKVEPNIATSMVSGPSLPQMSSVPRPVSQGVPGLQTSSPLPVSQEMIPSNDTQDLKPLVSMAQSLRPVGAILNNLSQARVMNSAALTGGTSLALQSMSGNPIGIHMSNMISSGMASSVAPSQTLFSSGQSAITTVSGSGTMTGTSQPMQSSAVNSFTSASSNVSGNSNLSISLPLSNLQGGVSMSQSVSSMSQGNAPQIAQSGAGINPNMMANLGSTGVSSGTGTMIPTPGMSQPVQPGVQPVGINNISAANMPMSQQASTSMPSAQSKYVKVWEGDLSGQRQGQPVFITRLEGYRNASASETLAANWPATMQIVRLISQDHMNNKQYVGKADFLVFRAMQQHGFLQQLQEKKLCAVIQLPSQTLLLSVSDKACRLIGMLFPGDMVVFKPQNPSQQQQQQMQQQNQQQQQQQQPHPQLQHQQHPQLQQQLQHLQQQPMQQQQQQQLSQLQPQPLQQQQLSQLQQQPMQQLQQPPPMQQLQQQTPLQQLQQQTPLQQMQQQLPQMPLQSQPQQMVGTGIGQAYVQGPGRQQLISQGQVSSQGPSNLPGGGFLS